MPWWLRRILSLLSFGLYYRIEDRFIIRRTRRLARRDLEEPLTLDHPALGAFLFHRQLGWYRREIDWCGRPVTVTFKSAPMETMRAMLDDIAQFFAERAAWRQRIITYALAEIPELRAGWELSEPNIADSVWDAVTIDGIWFDSGGAFHAHFSHYSAWPRWISVWGRLAAGPQGATIEI